MIWLHLKPLSMKESLVDFAFLLLFMCAAGSVINNYYLEKRVDELQEIAWDAVNEGDRAIELAQEYKDDFTEIHLQNLFLQGIIEDYAKAIKERDGQINLLLTDGR